MHNNHLLACAVAIGAALIFLRLSGGSISALGVLLIALACPVIMLIMMKYMMGGQSSSGHKPATADRDAVSTPDEQTIR